MSITEEVENTLRAQTMDSCRKNPFPSANDIRFYARKANAASRMVI